MGLRFRKSIKLSDHLRLNLNKKSIGLSAGTKGARFSVNSRGKRTSTVGIAGTGLSYSTTSGGKKSRSRNHIGGKTKGRGTGCLLFVVLFLIIGVIAGGVRSCMGIKDETQLEWSSKEAIVTELSYTQKIKLKVKGEKKADEISSDLFKVEIADKSLCTVEYKDASYSYVEFNVKPVKNGETTVTVSYDGVTSEPLLLKIDINDVSKDDSKSESKTIAKTTTTTVTTSKKPTITTQQREYLLNPNSMKVHKSNCRTIKIKDNYNTSTDLQEALNNGYEKCKVCNPY